MIYDVIVVGGGIAGLMAAIEAKDDLEFFFNILEKSEPKSIGGKIPDLNLYYK